MKKQTWIVISLAAILLFPSFVHSGLITINSIMVSINGSTLGPLAGWGLPQTLGEGQSLQIGQIGPGFSFDTSDVSGCNANPPACFGTIAVATSVGGFTFMESFATLGGRQNGSFDPQVSNTFNEASQYRADNLTSGTPGILSAFTGYFDNSHTDVCTDTNANGEIAGNCRPDFAATFNRFTGATLLDGVGINNFVTANPSHCFTGAADNSQQTNCFDGGLILLVNNSHATTPEPMSLWMLGVGFLTMAKFARRIV